MSHKIAQHVHVFSVSQDNAADTKERMYITERNNSINLLISYATRVDSDSHTPTPQPPPHTVTSR